MIMSMSRSRAHYNNFSRVKSCESTIPTGALLSSRTTRSSMRWVSGRLSTSTASLSLCTFIGFNVIRSGTSRLEQHHRDPIPQRHHHRRARGWCKIQPTRLLFDVHVEKHVCVFRQGGIGIPANRDDLHLESRDRRQNPEQFLGFTTRA